jgi:dolichol-phosphate mannosyltransferase
MVKEALRGNVKLTIVVPTFNEQENIGKLIEEIKLVVKTNDYEIVVVDDGNDKTKEIASSLGARILQGQHKGLGQAIIDGIIDSKSEIVLVMDSDLSHPVSAIPRMIQPIIEDGYTMVIGSRYVKGGAIVGWTAKRKLISLVASAIAFPITFKRDNTSGYFAIKRSIVDGVELKGDSWKTMLEILVKAKPKAIEVPISFTDRVNGESKFNKKQVIAYLKHLVKLFFFKYREILNFMAVGGIGYVINMGLYWILTPYFHEEVTFLGQHFYLPPFVVSSYVAIFSNYYLNKIWTFKKVKERKAGILRYVGMASVTLLADMFLLFVLVDYGNMYPQLAAMLAVAMMFIVRYLVAKTWIWGKK